MKKYLTILLLAPAMAFSQQKPDTSKLIPFHQGELNIMYNQLQNIGVRLHRLDIPALKRDSIDGLILNMQQVMLKRYQEVMEKKEGRKR